MKAVRLHEYGHRPVVEEVAEPRIDGPLASYRGGASGAGRATSSFPTRWATRTPAGCMRWDRR
jgi:hypothetical protein